MNERVVNGRILLVLDFCTVLLMLGPHAAAGGWTREGITYAAVLAVLVGLVMACHLTRGNIWWRDLLFFLRVAFIPAIPFIIPLPALSSVVLTLTAQFSVFYYWPFTPAAGISLLLLGATGYAMRVHPTGPGWLSLAPGGEWFGFMLACAIGGGSVALGVFQWHKRRAELDLLARERLASTSLAEANIQLQVYAAQLEEFAALEERNRLARDIHDTLGHSLTAIIVQLEGITNIISGDPDRAAAALQRARNTALSAMQEVRHSVAALRLPTSSRECGKILWQRVAGTFAECTNILVTTDFEGDFADIPFEHNEAVMHFIEEGLTNAVRHGHATRVDVSVAWREGFLLVRISDNGRGISVLEEGNGLRGVRERAGALNGSIAWVSELGQGFDLGVDIPWQRGQDGNGQA